MKKILPFIIALLSVAVCSLLLFTSLDQKIADYFQRAIPPLKEQKNVIMINVDDGSVENIGTWPFSRDVYAKMLISLKELGTESVVFDLSFLDKSSAKVDETYITEKLPQYVENYFGKIDESIAEVLGGYASGALGKNDAEDAAEMLMELTQNTKNEINTSISYVIMSQDESLARALKFFENSYLTLTFGDGFAFEGEEKRFVESNISLKNIEHEQDSKTRRYSGIQPAIQEFLRNAKSAGFVNADPEKDGYLRRVALLLKRGENYYGQLVFVPLLAHFGNPQVEVADKFITLKNAKLDDGTTRDIKIPRSQDGRFIVKYPPKNYVDYNNIPLWNIYRLSLLEEQLVENLKGMDESGFFSEWEGESPLEIYNAASYIQGELLNGVDEEAGITYKSYYEYRNAFFESLKKFFSGEFQSALVASVEGDAELEDFIRKYFEVAGGQFSDLIASRQDVKSKVEKAICIVGTCATSTSDYGLNQYEEHYPNPGVHYTIANQILTQDFVSDLPFWVSLAAALAICLVYVLIAHKIKGTGFQLLAGIAFLIVTAGACLAFFILTKIYVGAAVPVVSVFLSFITTTAISLLTASKDKKFITNAFSQCLSKDVVNDIINNPSGLKLGGVSREMTAIFTDIQKFSGFSELLNAAELVALLNYYLTKMSDIIMEERGTVDKYEGDAIIALVGAPLEMSDHAARACAAAIKMKKAEILMNKEILEIASGEKPAEMPEELYSAFRKMVQNKRSIFTRIGINSGEMVAGFMGSENKKNYTMMGNNVNLAARLEGVNKQYSTGGILISEATRNLIGDEFLVRSLDRVQVVNVNTPMRLYELLDTSAEANPNMKKYVEYWEMAMKLFEQGEYVKAYSLFRKLYEKRASDNVCRYYITLLGKFFTKGTYPKESDDFGVAYNAENPADMNPEWIGTKYEIKGTFRLLQK